MRRRSLKITRRSRLTEVFLGLGSNLGDRKGNCLLALKKLEEKVGSILALSSPYLTSPYGVKDQPWFINCVCKIGTSLSPRKLLEICQSVELELGRVRKVKWGPRVIDIDILIYNDLVMDEDDLKIPHPELEKRLFFLLPMAEIDGFLVNPATGKTVEYAVRHGQFKDQEIIKVSWGS